MAQLEAVQDANVAKTTDGAESTSAKVLSECKKDFEDKSSRKRDDIANKDGSIDFLQLELDKLYGSDAANNKGTRSQDSTQATASDRQQVEAAISQPKDDHKAADTTKAYEPEQAGKYHGEVITRDVAPVVVTDTKGKTLHDIAKEHLGAGASEDEIKKHEKEIAQLNHMQDNNKALDGRPLTLPGHAKDGAFITLDSDGNTRSTWGDGTVVVKNKDNTGYAKHIAKDGSYSEHHWGPKPEDNYEVKRTADGKYQVAEAFTTNFKDVKDSDHDARAERAKLRDMAESKISDPKALARFEEDMVRLDARAKQLEDTYEKQGMKPADAHNKAQEEIAKTYQQVERLLEKNDKAAVPENRRVELAEQVMHQAANPTTISQGDYNTCNVTTIEARTYTTNPSEAARVVADVALTGQYTTAGGTTVKLDKDSLQPHGQAKTNPPADGERSFASQLYEVTAVNVHYAAEHASGGKDIRYEQHEGKKGAKPAPDNGERLMDYSDPKHPKEVVSSDGKTDRSPSLSDKDIVQISRQMGSNPDAPVILVADQDSSARLHQAQFDSNKTSFELELIRANIKASDKYDVNLEDPNAVNRTRDLINSSKDIDQAKKDELNKKLDDLLKEKANHNEDGVAMVRNEKQLEETLAKAQAAGQLPMVVKVWTYHEPFLTDSGDKDTSETGGAHVVTITGFHPAEAGPPAKPARIEYDNQWDQGSDHNGDKSISTHDLFIAMQQSRGITDLQINKVLKQSDADHDKEMAELMLRSERRWKQEQADGNYDKSEHDQLVHAWKEELRNLKPPSRAQAIIKQLGDGMKNEGLTDPSNHH